MIKVIEPVDRYDIAGKHLDPTVIEVGDRVAWLSGNHRMHGSGAVMAIVTRLTPTQIVVSTTLRSLAYRFKRDTGQMYGTGGWGVFLLDPADPRIVNARVLSVARQAVRDIETMARTATCKDIDTATAALESVRAEANVALDRMARLLTDQPVAD